MGVIIGAMRRFVAGVALALTISSVTPTFAQSAHSRSREEWVALARSGFTLPDGVRIVNFNNAALANQFGIQKGDVILRINGTPVRDQSHAVSVIKQLLKTKGSSPIIRVTIRRRGAEKELKFDTRDPATRRAAKKAFK